MRSKRVGKAHSLIVFIIYYLKSGDSLVHKKNNLKVEDIVEQLVQDILQSAPARGGSPEAAKAIELVDVEYVKEKNRYLRVFLDAAGGVELDDCQWVSEELGERLDELDLIKEEYYLEVSSPGLDRQLKKEKDFIRCAHQMVEVKLYEPLTPNGAKNIVGELDGLKEGVLHIKDARRNDIDKEKKNRKNKISAAGEISDCLIPWEKVASVKLHIEF